MWKKTEQGFVFEGEGFGLRPIGMEDTENIVRWRNSHRVRKNFIYQKPFTKEGQENWLRTKVASGEVVQFILFLRDGQSQIPVGSIYFRDLDLENKKAEYGIFIGEEWAAGKGLGSKGARAALTFARDYLKLHKVFLRVFTDNEAAVRSYKNAGFSIEAHLKDEIRTEDGYRDMYLMAVLFEENR